MPPPNPAPGSATDWLARAKGKLVLAEASLPDGGYWEDLSFCAQQAAELAIKAVYQHYNWRFRFTHDLGDLLDGLSRLGLAIPLEVQDADQLSVFAVQTRYPGFMPVSKARYEQAVQIANRVLAWVETIVT